MSNLCKSFSTKAIRCGQECEEKTGAIIPPIFQTSTYVQISPGKHKGFEYSRCVNPTRTNLETCLSALEGANYCVTTATGLGAITTVFNLFKNGANIICGDDVYGGVYRLLETIFEDRYNVKWVDTTNIENLEKACEEFGKVDLIWVEATSNPLLKITDIKRSSEIAKKYGAILGVDSTFLTPYLQKPLKLGADIAVHSLTKYINGHSDVLGGAILTDNEDMYKKVFHIQKTTGPTLSPFDSWLVLRGVKTLEIRMDRHQENAKKVVEFLQNHPKIDKILYPGLESHKGYEFLKSQTENKFSGGGMISIYIKGNADKFLENIKIIQLAESLGGVESLACLPAKMTHASIPKEVRDERGVTDNLVRLSIGIEGIDDIISDINSALMFC